MAKLSKIRLTLAVKLLIMFLTVLIIANITFGEVAYRKASAGMTQSVYSQIDAISTDVVNQIEAINNKHFTSLHFLANLSFMKDETVSLEEKGKQLEGIVKALGGNYENVAFYDKDGNAITADGRYINMKERPYFYEALAGKDYLSNPTFSPVVNGILQQYSVPVYDNNRRAIGVVVMLIKGNSLLETIQKIDMGGGMHPSVIDYPEAELAPDRIDIQTDGQRPEDGTVQQSDALGIGDVVPVHHHRYADGEHDDENKQRPHQYDRKRQ